MHMQVEARGPAWARDESFSEGTKQPKLPKAYDGYRMYAVPGYDGPDGAFKHVTLRAWELLPCSPQLRTLQFSGMSLLDNWALLPTTLQRLDLTMPTSGRNWEDTDGLMWLHKLEQLQALPCLTSMRLVLPISDPNRVLCFAGRSGIWQQLTNLSITLLHDDTELWTEIFSAKYLPRLQSLQFLASWDGMKQNWRKVFDVKQVWPHLSSLTFSHLAVTQMACHEAFLPCITQIKFDPFPRDPLELADLYSEDASDDD